MSTSTPTVVPARPGNRAPSSSRPAIVLAAVALSMAAATLVTLTVLVGWWTPAPALAATLGGLGLVVAVACTALALHRADHPRVDLRRWSQPEPASADPRRWSLAGRRRPGGWQLVDPDVVVDLREPSGLHRAPVGRHRDA